MAFLLGVGLGAYWWKAIRPFYTTQQAILQSATMQISAVESGKLEGYAFQEGDFFHQGQFLLSIQNGLLSGQLNNLESEIENAKLRIEEEKERLEQAMQSYIHAQPEVMDIFLSDVQEAQQNGADLEQELTILLSERDSLKKKIEGLSSPAPFEGIVLRQLKQAGEFATAGESVLLVCDAKQRWVEAEIPESLLTYVQIGSVATVEFLSYPGKKWSASISWISPIVENGKFKVKLVADHFPLQSGLSAKASIRIH